MEAGARTIDLLWMGSLVAIPLAGIVGLACRTFVTRPATRHAMWVATLFSLVMPLLGAMVWEVPRVSSTQLRKVASTKLKLINPNVSNSVRHTLGKDHHETSPPPLASLDVGEETPSPEAGRPAPVTNACESSALSFAPSEPVDGLADIEACDTYSGNMPPHLWQALATSIAPGVELSPAFLRSVEDSDTVSDALMPVSEGATSAGVSVCAADDRRAPTPIASSQIPTPLSAEPLLSPTPEDGTAQLVPTGERSLSAETSVFISAWIDRILLLRDSISTLPRMPTVVWLLGMLILAILQAVRTWAAAKVLRSAVPASREVLAMVGALSEQVGLERAPATYFVTARVSPMIWCGLRPRLLVPQHLWESLDDHSRKAVLVHELAHLARKDHVLCWIENVIGAKTISDVLG